MTCKLEATGVVVLGEISFGLCFSSRTAASSLLNLVCELVLSFSSTSAQKSSSLYPSSVSATSLPDPWSAIGVPVP